METIASSNPNGVSVTLTWDDLNRLSSVIDNRLPSAGWRAQSLSILDSPIKLGAPSFAFFARMGSTNLNQQAFSDP